MKKIFLALTFFCTIVAFSQVKIGGVVVDDQNETVPFANVVFVNSTIGTVSDENGKFYLESEENFSEIEVSFIGYETKRITTNSRDLELRIVLKEADSQLDEVVIYSGKTKKKGNPAIAILKKVWEKKRKNGTYLFDQYEYEKYEKVEFDMNNIDSTMMKRKIFKGMEFIFEKIDTSRITGKAYLPIFINEAVNKTYGDNVRGKLREDLIANKNSGFDNNQYIISFIKDLYVDYDIYDNYIKLFDKSFVSPLSKTGVSTYNMYLQIVHILTINGVITSCIIQDEKVN